MSSDSHSFFERVSTPKHIASSFTSFSQRWCKWIFFRNTRWCCIICLHFNIWSLDHWVHIPTKYTISISSLVHLLMLSPLWAETLGVYLWICFMLIYTLVSTVVESFKILRHLLSPEQGREFYIIVFATSNYKRKGLFYTLSSLYTNCWSYFGCLMASCLVMDWWGKTVDMQLYKKLQ